MDPAATRTAIAGMVAAATGLDASRIYWHARPIGYTGEAYAVLRLASIAPIGKDETWYDYDATRPPGAELVPRQAGLRRFTLSAQFRSYSATDTGDAVALAIALQDRIRLDEHRDALAVADVALASVGPLIEMTMTESDREMSVVAIDIAMNAQSDAAGTAIGYVEQWGITGDAEMADGSTETIIDGVYP